MPYLDAAGWVQRGESGQNIVALGGGHGLSATLRALRHITRALTAVVTVAAGQGGPSGRWHRCRGRRRESHRAPHLLEETPEHRLNQ